MYRLIQVLVVPLSFAPIAYMAGRSLKRQTGWLAFIPLAYTLTLLLSVALEIAEGSPYLEIYRWAPEAGLTFGLLADGLSIWMLLTINILCLLVSLYSIPYMEHRFHEWEHETGEHIDPRAYGTYYALYLLYAVGMMGTVMATNLIEFYLFYELMLVPSWALINNYGYGERERIGMMYFLWTHVGAVVLLAGILSSYWVTGSFEIEALRGVVGSPLAPWIAIAILIGFFTKMAVFGLHIWLPYAHAEAPTPISALLSPAMIGIGAYAAARLVIIPLNPVARGFSLVFSLWALLTMVYGGLMALAQDDIKRFLAYSSVSQMGYLFLGLASAAAYGVSGTIFHYVSHGLGKCILFGVAGILICQVGTRSIKEMGGLADKMPLTAILTLLGFFTIGGVPPTMGFMSKFMIFSGLFGSALAASPEAVAIAIVAIVMTVLTVGYSLWTIRRIFFGPLPERLEGVEEAPLSMTVPLLILAVISVVGGIYPRLITDYLLSQLAALLS
ncbi:MAG: NADH-quinone oxidoreductase subunit M (nuoM) [Candidatus Bathyarchaeota archaeon B23]|nr:MAG: NADH-quinone oxidoreductase subunit M (nuoM) [Candidatus Bathyarchaeota archaeon B23]